MTNEVGRSMVETLGILAIMGVLSVVGLAGYNSAMDKSKANTLIQEAQKRAVIVAGQIGFNNQTPSLAEFEPYNTTSAGTFGDVITKGLSGQFGIQVSNVSKSICQNVLNAIGDTTPIRRLSKEGTPTTPISSCDEDNAFLFIYNNDMTGENDTQYCESDESCGACGVCSSTTHLCEGECIPPENECDDATDCNTKNECMICDTETHKCKDGCERVQYLESTGTQYIDTGINIKNGIKLKTKITFLSSGGQVYFGVQQDVPGIAYYGSNQLSNDSGYFNVGYYDNHRLSERIVVGSTHTYEYSSELGNCYLKQDGTTLDTNSNSNLYYDGNLYLFALNTGRRSYTEPVLFATMKMYSCSINGSAVRDFVPVIAPSGRACMFNKIPDENGKLKLFCDANGGTFKTNKDN